MKAMGRIIRVSLGAAAVSLLCLAAAAGPAAGTEALREDFEGRAAAGVRTPGRDTPSGYRRSEREFEAVGSRTDQRAFAPGAAAKGAISFDLQRVAVETEAERSTIFTFAGDAGKGDGAPADEVFFLQVGWESGFDPARPSLFFRGDIYHEFGLGLWPPEVVIDRPVQPGEWIHVDLAWDDAARRYDVYVDGRRQDTVPLFYDLKTRQRQPDYRPLLNEESRRAKAEPYFKSWRFAQLLALVDEVDFGAHTRRSQPVAVYTPLSDAVLDNFTVHLEEIPTPGYVPPPSTAPAIASVAHDAFRVAGFSGELVAGNTLTVTAEGTPGAAGTFDIVHYPDLDRKIALDWRGWGVYLEEKVFFDPGEVNLREVEGYRVYAAREPIDLGALAAPPAGGAPPLEPVKALDVKEQAYTLEHLEANTPYYVAVVAEMRDGTLRPVISPIGDRPLAESAPGVYTGTYTVTFQDRYPRAVIVARLASGTASALLAGDAASAFAVDPSLTIAVATEPTVLKADEKSTAKVTVTVTDANGNAVPGHDIRFLLATTSQYTGVVGGGAFTEQVGGAIKSGLRGQTDLFGRLTATYVAGFAAKTAVIVARDMTSNSTGAGYVTTFIQSTAQLELEPVTETAAMAAGYEISVTSSDAWLTADGKSQARITARVTQAGRPVAGHQVRFGIAAGTGQIRTVLGATDADGEARAVYTAGVKIGVVLITATDVTVDLSGSVQIELRSDAPAKIAITVDPAKLPADGSSRAELSVLVTDINDNPNDNVEVEYAITEGGGGLRDVKSLTDRRGETANTYTAGSAPGRVSIEITVRSPVPTEEEFVKARDLAVAVADSKFF